MTTEKEKALELAIDHIEKRFGKGSIMKLGETATMGIEAIPTGSLALDMGDLVRRKLVPYSEVSLGDVLGNGSCPRSGRHYEASKVTPVNLYRWRRRSTKVEAAYALRSFVRTSLNLPISACEM